MRASTRRGFTVVEVLISTVILAFGVMAGVALMGTGFRWQGQAELTTQLTVAAESKIEELKAAAGSQAPDTIELELGGALESNTAGHWDTAEEDGRKIERRWTVRPGPAGALVVTVAARPASRSVARRVELSTNLIHR